MMSRSNESPSTGSGHGSTIQWPYSGATCGIFAMCLDFGVNVARVIREAAFASLLRSRANLIPGSILARFAINSSSLAFAFALS